MCKKVESLSTSLCKAHHACAQQQWQRPFCHPTILHRCAGPSAPRLLADAIIRIYHECEGRIEKSVPRVHRLSSRGNGDPEGRIFSILPSHELIMDTTDFIYLFIQNKLPEVPEYAMMQFHMMAFLGVLGKIAWVR